jgi:adenine-specific DNA-methyltransferase
MVERKDKKVPLSDIAKKKPLRAVFRDSGFSDDQSKINVLEIFKCHAPDTQVKVI